MGTLSGSGGTWWELILCGVPQTDGTLLSDSTMVTVVISWYFMSTDTMITVMYQNSDGTLLSDSTVVTVIVKW